MVSARAAVFVPSLVSVAVTVVLTIAILGAFFARGGLQQRCVQRWDGLERAEFIASDRAVQILIEILEQLDRLCQIGEAVVGDYCVKSFVLDICL